MRFEAGNTWHVVKAVPRHLWRPVGKRRLVEAQHIDRYVAALSSRHRVLAELATGTMTLSSEAWTAEADHGRTLGWASGYLYRSANSHAAIDRAVVAGVVGHTTGDVTDDVYASVGDAARRTISPYPTVKRPVPNVAGEAYPPPACLE
jgi:hypothetical protein